MPTVLVGQVARLFCPVADTITVTPGAGGRCSINGRGRDGGQTIEAREIYVPTAISVVAGDTLLIEAIGADATYNSPTGANSPVSGDGFNGQYDPASNPFYFGPQYPNNAPQTTRIVKSATLPYADRPSLSTFELGHDGGTGYIFHLTGHANMSTGALIGLGIDYGGIGLFCNNKGTGKGIVITQMETITGARAYGLLVNAGPGAAPGVWIQQNNIEGSGSAQPGLVLFAYQSFSSSQRLMEWRKPNGTNDGALAGFIKSEDGSLVVQAPVAVSGGNLTVTAVSGVGGAISGVSASLVGDGSLVDIYNTAATANQRRFRLSITSRFLLLSARNDAGTSIGDLMAFEAAANNVGFCGTTSFGGGGKVIAVPNAATVPASNPTGGGVLYAENGALKWRGSAGTVTTIAEA
jgi:hypothetical protein